MWRGRRAGHRRSILDTRTLRGPPTSRLRSLSAPVEQRLPLLELLYEISEIHLFIHTEELEGVFGFGRRRVRYRDQWHLDHDDNLVDAVDNVILPDRPATLPHLQSDRRPRGEIHLPPIWRLRPVLAAERKIQRNRQSISRANCVVEGFHRGNAPPRQASFPQRRFAQQLNVVDGGGRTDQLQIQVPSGPALLSRHHHDRDGSMIRAVPESKNDLLHVVRDGKETSVDHFGDRDTGSPGFFALGALAEGAG
ncbi:hypothetical protein B0E53_06917 [Micromonospora sp. MH33]|nr:hypothetical protein B0E53_06917 [Micromonospora sp. MH33]